MFNEYEKILIRKALIDLKKKYKRAEKKSSATYARDRNMGRIKTVEEIEEKLK